MSFETMLYLADQKKKLKMWEKKLHDSIFKELLIFFLNFFELYSRTTSNFLMTHVFVYSFAYS